MWWTISFPLLVLELNRNTAVLRASEKGLLSSTPATWKMLPLARPRAITSRPAYMVTLTLYRPAMFVRAKCRLSTQKFGLYSKLGTQLKSRKNGHSISLQPGVTLKSVLFWLWNTSCFGDPSQALKTTGNRISPVGGGGRGLCWVGEGGLFVDHHRALLREGGRWEGEKNKRKERQRREVQGSRWCTCSMHCGVPPPSSLPTHLLINFQ